MAPMLFMYAVAAFSCAIVLLLPCSVETNELSTEAGVRPLDEAIARAVVISTYDKAS